MNSRKLFALLVAGLMLTASAAAININIDLIDFGGDGGGDNDTANNTEDNSDDQEFSYGGTEPDSVTDDSVEKSFMEALSEAIVNTLFG